MRLNILTANKILLLVILVSIMSGSCTSDTPNETTTTETDTTAATPAPPKREITPRMEEIRQILIGDWIEDSVEFKRVYNMPPPPVQNTRVRYQEDGYVYIPGVLLAKEHWDTWEIVNDTTLHIIKRQGYGTRVFIIDSISQDYIKYRLLLPPNTRYIGMQRIKGGFKEEK